MKKIIIAIFIVIATLGIAAGTTAKKAPVKTTSKTTTTTKKSTSTPKKEVTDPYVGWWYYELDQFNILSYITKKNEKYYFTKYIYSPKEKGQVFCKRYMGAAVVEITKEEILEWIKGDPEDPPMRKATKEQVETLKYNLENMKGWMKEPCGE